MLDKKIYNKQWRKDNPDKVKKINKRYCQNNREKVNGYARQWRKDNPEKIKSHQLKCRYGLSYEEWLQMWENQDSKCAICGDLFIKPSDAYVDHNHKTGEIRGLLCKRCNLSIGLFDDDSELMKKAMEYCRNK